MDEYILLISFLALIVVLSICIWLIAVKIAKERESEFVVNHNILTNTIDLYKESILVDEIKILMRKYDLNEKSQTNSIQAFENAKKELISGSVKKIMKDYLSKECLKSLLRHYSVDGLSLLIITHLKR